MSVERWLAVLALTALTACDPVSPARDPVCEIERPPLVGGGVGGVDSVGTCQEAGEP